MSLSSAENSVQASHDLIVPAQKILYQIKYGEPINYNNVIINGDLELLGNDTNTSNTINSEIRIENARINGKANFYNLTIKKPFSFKGTSISGPSSFAKVRFGKEANFEKSEFMEPASFYEVEFNGHTNFDEAIFNKSADFWKSNFAKTMVSACKESEGAALCFSSKIFSGGLDFKRKIIFKLLSDVKDLSLVFMCIFRKRILFDDAFYLAQLSHMIFSKKLIKGITFDQSYKFSQDWKFVVQIQKKTKIKIVPKKLLYFRFHDKSASFKNREKWLFYRKLIGELPRSADKGVFIRFFSFYISLFSKLC